MKSRLKVILAALLMLLLCLTPALPARADEAAPMQNGTVDYYATASEEERLTDIYHYSDEWFFK